MAGAGVARDVVLPEPPRDRDGERPLAQVHHSERAFDDLVPTGALNERLQTLVEE
ncbi:hypothetical protein [Capillimicrobium parvum]|uniref:hypothetical protein n=1 Tax=Capillimicrobium parvum TaxID=2884022 RepID=UPI00216B33E5|nr:hypothetical protein [Capillimicrobium parvum]